MNFRHVLNRWKIVHAKAPDTGQYLACIEGAVASSNPRFPQASIIRTSYLTAYEIDASSFVVITARRSEYVLGTRHPSEFLSEDFLKSFLPERKQAPVQAAFDGAGSQILGHLPADDRDAPSTTTQTRDVSSPMHMARNP